MQSRSLAMHAQPAPRGAPVIATYVTLLVVVWIAMTFAGLEPHDPRWALEPRIRGISDLWRLLGHAFVHMGFSHLAGNVLILWLAGRPLERMIGSRAMVGLLTLGVLAGAITTIVDDDLVLAVGASGAGFAVVGASLVVLMGGWRELPRSTRWRLVIPLLLAALSLALWVGVIESFSLHVYKLRVAMHAGPEVASLMHAVAMVVGVGAGIALLGPWSGAPRRPRALGITCAFALIAAFTLALFRRVEPPPRAEGLARCEAGDLAQCRKIGDHLRTECSSGDARSCHDVGALLERGLEGKVDAAVAAYYYQRGCDGGFTGSCVNLAIMLYAGELPADDERGRMLSAQACDDGSDQGCSMLGVYLMDGRGGAKDLVAARTALRVGCRTSFVACTNLGRLTWEGLGGEPDPDEALRLYERACKSGQVPESCEMLERARAQNPSVFRPM